MTRPKARLLALSFGLALGAALGGVAWWLRPVPEASGEVLMLEDRAGLDALFAERTRDRAAGMEQEGDPTALLREPLDEAAARRLFPQIGANETRIVFDPHCYFRLAGGVKRRIRSSFHPQGVFYFVTNSLGLRQEEEVLDSPPDLRVLATGDSQTEGYTCNASESFPAQLEAFLDRPGRSAEVLNGAVSGYSLYHYVGVLERLIDLKPDMFLLCVYGGNDFAESLPLYHYFHRSQPARCDPCDMGRAIRAAPAVPASIFRQSMRQIALFKHHPDERAAALSIGIAVAAEVQRICAAHGIRLICVYLPDLTDVQPKLYADAVDGGAAAYGLEPEDLDDNGELGDEWVAAVRTMGIEVVDVRTALVAQQRLYWEDNHHLNLMANRLVARAIAEAIDG